MIKTTDEYSIQYIRIKVRKGDRGIRMGDWRLQLMNVLKDYCREPLCPDHAIRICMYVL